MNHINLNINNFYIFSYPPFSEKNNQFSKFKNKLLEKGFPKEGIIDVNEIGKNLLGVVPSFNPFNERIGEFNLSNFSCVGHINLIIEEIIKLRLTQGLPTILIGNFQTKSKFDKFLNISKDLGYESLYYFFDIKKDKIYEHHNQSSHIYPLTIINEFLEKYNLSNTPVFSDETDIFISVNNVQHKDLEIIGDTHGMFDLTFEHLSKKGWKLNNNTMGFYHEDKNKALMFLGDILDRHKDSIKLLKTIKATCENGQGYLLLGNHEIKLINSYQNFLSTGVIKGKSISSSQTLANFFKLSASERKSLFGFLISRPTSYSLFLDENLNISNSYNSKWRFGFIHGDVTNFDPFNNSLSNSLYGVTKDFLPLEKKNDFIYEQGFEAGINKYIVFRGHTFNHGEYKSIYSLEFDQAFEGYLASINFIDYINSFKKNNFIFNHQLFKDNTSFSKSNYNFDLEIEKSIYGKILSLKHSKVISPVLPNTKSSNDLLKEGFQLFTNNSKLLFNDNDFFNNLNGIVFDIGGNLVSYPLNKDIEQNLEGLTFSPSDVIRIVEKINNDLIFISKHPYRNDIIIHSSNGFDCDHILNFKSSMDFNFKNKILNYLNNKGEHTFAFNFKDNDLYLIGTRDLKNLNLKDKEQLDQIAHELCCLRPSSFLIKFEDLLKQEIDKNLYAVSILNDDNIENFFKNRIEIILKNKKLSNNSTLRLKN